MGIIEGYLDIKEYVPGQSIKSWCGDVYEVLRVVKSSKETIVRGKNGKLYTITWGHNNFFLNDDTDFK